MGRKLDTRHFLIDDKRGRIVFDMGYMSDNEIKLLLREFTLEHQRRNGDIKTDGDLQGLQSF